MYKYSDFIVVFNVELFLVNTETPLKSKNKCWCFKGPTLRNLQLQRSILIPQSFYYVALPFMQKLICEIKSVDKILWYKCTDTSLAFVANFVLINYQWMNCSEFHVQPTSFGFNVLEFSRVFPRPGFPRSKLSQASQPGPPPTVDKKGGVGNHTLSHLSSRYCRL